MRNKKGFTLIELMIALSVIAILSVVVIPNVGSVKTESKNQSVAANTLLVRSYLENRSGKDSIAYATSINSGSTSTAVLTGLLKIIGDAMTEYFSASNTIQNPFNYISSINYSASSAASNNSTSASVVLGCNSIDSLPADNNAVITALPSGKNFTGDVVAVIYSTGYVVYGIDNSGNMVNINIIKFPPAPPIVQSGVSGGNTGGGTGGTTSGTLQGNVNSVVSYIRSIAIDRILNSPKQMWAIMQGTLYTDLNNQFTPGNASKHIVNPFYANADVIGNGNGYVDPNVKYSIISDPTQSNDAIEGTKYSNRAGTVIVCITANPVGYVVYGVDQNGQNVSYTKINLSTLVTADMTQALGNNVALVANTLSSNIVNLANGDQGTMSTNAYNILKNLSMGNAYLPNWTNRANVNTTDFKTGYALIVGSWNMEGANYPDYKGTVVVDVLENCTGYEIFGVDYTGSKYAYTKVVK
ncbi:MAG: type II secretion system protein [Bacillota bacterium]|nr:type II secretion system protein [Bacillota bacterium]